MIETNSPIGSSHWFRTIVSNIKSIGQFIRNKELSINQRIILGSQLFDYSDYLIEHHAKINVDWKESNQKKRNRVFIRSKAK